MAVIPVFFNGVGREFKVDRGDGGNGIHTEAFRMSSQRHAVTGVVAGNVRNHNDSAFCRCHHIFQYQFTLFYRVIDAFTGGAAHIKAGNTLANQVFGKCPDAFGAEGAVSCVAGIKGGENTFEF